MDDCADLRNQQPDTVRGFESPTLLRSCPAQPAEADCPVACNEVSYDVVRTSRLSERNGGVPPHELLRSIIVARPERSKAGWEGPRGNGAVATHEPWHIPTYMGAVPTGRPKA